MIYLLQRVTEKINKPIAIYGFLSSFAKAIQIKTIASVTKIMFKFITIIFIPL